MAYGAADVQLRIVVVQLEIALIVVSVLVALKQSGGSAVLSHDEAPLIKNGHSQRPNTVGKKSKSPKKKNPNIFNQLGFIFSPKKKKMQPTLTTALDPKMMAKLKKRRKERQAKEKAARITANNKSGVKTRSSKKTN